MIGGFRTRYRSIGEGDKPERGPIDPFINIKFKLGQAVDPSGVMLGDKQFKDIQELQAILASNPERLLKNLLEQFAVYSTGRPIAFSDRDQIANLVESTMKNKAGVRTLLQEFVQSEMFQTR